jgi:hypothetical protein
MVVSLAGGATATAADRCTAHPETTIDSTAHVITRTEVLLLRMVDVAVTGCG